MNEALLAVLAGVIGVPLVQYLKKLLGWEGDLALILTAVVSAVLSIAALAITGQILPIDLTNIVEKIGLAFSVATILYKLIVAKL